MRDEDRGSSVAGLPSLQEGSDTKGLTSLDKRLIEARRILGCLGAAISEEHAFGCGGEDYSCTCGRDGNVQSALSDGWGAARDLVAMMEALAQSGTTEPITRSGRDQ
jgi:hypothetical protein